MPGFSLKARLRSVGYALAGLAWLLRSQHNTRIHLASSLAVIALAGWLRVQREDWLWLLLAIAMVWAAELFNTALEQLADALMPERHPLVGRAKDLAAAAVLVTAMLALLIGLLVFWPYLLPLAQH